MTQEGVYEPGDTIEVDGITLEAKPAATDGSGCYVCDDEQNKCWFQNLENAKGSPCPKCHSKKFFSVIM